MRKHKISELFGYDLISIVVPCYNEEAVLQRFYEEMSRVIDNMRNSKDINNSENNCENKSETDKTDKEVKKENNKIEFELIFVDDGSMDNTLNIIKEFAKKDDCVNYISFSRNFGKEAAILAGLEYSDGDYVCIMDADLQDPPSLLPEMYSILKNDSEYDSVATRRVSRKGEPPIRSFFARQFYKIMNKISDTDLMDGARDYRLMTRQFVESLLGLKEYNRFSKGLFGWVGYKTKWLEYENIERAAGETKWSFFKLLLYAIDGIVAFSTVPLAVVSLVGMLMLFVSLFFIILIIIKTIVFHDPTAGWPSLVCIITLIGGLQIFCLGIIGQYLSKTYLETKKRPNYIVKERD